MGQKNYPIPYNLKSAGYFFILSIILFVGITLSYKFIENMWIRLLISAVSIFIYLLVVIKKELPLSSWPVIGKYFNKKETTGVKSAH